ncbi:MAG: MucR family transcriptional regulator, partial [Pseudonocardiaceae bacterium]
MTSTAAARVNRSWRAHSHSHLWSLPDGTGLHVPYGELVIEPGTGRVCCHLCGRWYVALGSHLRVHGHTADSYRDAMGLCRSRPLVADALSRSIATRQIEAYRRSPELRARLAVGQEFSKT